jgi:hypothetical protein
MLSAALLLVILLAVGAAYAMNAWNRAIFDSLQERCRFRRQADGGREAAGQD